MQSLRLSLLLLTLYSIWQTKVAAQTTATYSNHTPIETQKLYINPDYARGGLDKQIFKSVTFIPLETTKESLFGKITQLEITADYYIVGDGSTRSILIFQKDGKFKSKIDGSKFQRGISTDFTVDRDRKLIITRSFKTLLWFNYEGKLVKELPMDEIYNTIASLDSNTIVYNPFVFLNNNVKKDSINYFIKFLKQEKPERQILPFNVLKYGTPGNFVSTDMPMPYHFYQSGLKNQLLFTGNYNTNIYDINNRGIQKIYTLIFPQANSLPADSIGHLSSITEVQTYLRKNDKQIYNLRGLYSMGNTLYFETVMTSLMAKDRYFAYNLKTQDVISLNKVSPGAMSHYLPLLSYYGSIIGCDTEFIYSTVSSLDMFQAKEQTAGKKPDYPPSLQEYFKTQSRKSNPVIVRMQPLQL